MARMQRCSFRLVTMNAQYLDTVELTGGRQASRCRNIGALVSTNAVRTAMYAVALVSRVSGLKRFGHLQFNN